MKFDNSKKLCKIMFIYDLRTIFSKLLKKKSMAKFIRKRDPKNIFNK